MSLFHRDAIIIMGREYRFEKKPETEKARKKREQASLLYKELEGRGIEIDEEAVAPST